MRRCCKAQSQQHLLFLPLTVVPHIQRKLLPGKIHVAQNGFHQRFVRAPGGDGSFQRARQAAHVLRHVGDHQPGGQTDAAVQRFALAHQRLEDAALAAAVGAGQRQPFALTEDELHAPADFPSVVADRAVFHGDQLLLGMVQCAQLQIAHPFYIVQ